MCKIRIEKEERIELLIGEERRKSFVNFLERYFKLVDEYCNKLNLDDKVCGTAKDAIKIFHENSLYARKPSCVAAAGVLIGCWLNGVLMKNCKVARVANIAEVSLSKSWKDIAKHMKAAKKYRCEKM